MKILTLTLLSLLMGVSAHASQGIPQPTCNIRGEVLGIHNRVEDGQGLSEGEKLYYLDLTLLVDQVSETEVGSGTDMCGNTIGNEHVYQMHGRQVLKAKKKTPPIGACIRANTNFFADGNFYSGNWIDDIQIVKITKCD